MSNIVKFSNETPSRFALFPAPGSCSLGDLYDLDLSVIQPFDPARFDGGRRSVALDAYEQRSYVEAVA